MIESSPQITTSIGNFLNLLRFFFVHRFETVTIVGIFEQVFSIFEIEAKLVEHPDVLEAAVVGRKADTGLVKPEAHVGLKEKINHIEKISEVLLQHCKTGLAPYKYPRWFQYPTELPKTATGKIQRFRLRLN